MPSKRRSPDRPVCIFGKVAFEFFNNDDEEFKLRSLKLLAKELRKELNVSCLPIEQSEVENPERGALVLAICGARRDHAKEQLDKALAFLDGKAPARILVEDFEEADIQ